MEGIIHYQLLERNLTVPAERHCQQLRRLEEAIKQKLPRRRIGVILQHDNAQTHTRARTQTHAHTHTLSLCKHDESGFQAWD
jgi:hypothetical protein